MLQLRHILDVYLSSLERTGFKIEESFSQAQMQSLTAAEKIAEKLTDQATAHPEPVLQGMLILAILTGDFVHLLGIVRNSLNLSES